MFRLSKILCFGWVLLFLTNCLVSQEEQTWYNFDQDYYEFSVDSTGIYTIDYNQLLAAGLEPNQLIGQNLVIYSYGAPVVLYTTTDGLWDEDDYLYFIGERNDGRLDQELFENHNEQQHNPKYNLYTDERAYFLSIEEHSYQDYRYAAVESGLDGPGIPPEEEYYIHTSREVFHDIVIKPTYNGRDFIRYSNYDTGEGFGSPMRHEHELSIPTPNLAAFGIDPRLKVRLSTNVYSRSVQLIVNGQVIKNLSSQGYGVIEFDEIIDRELLTGDSLMVSIQSTGEELAKSSIAFYELDYPRIYDFSDMSTIEYTQQASLLPRSVNIEGVGSSEPLLINQSMSQIVTPSIEGSVYKYIVPSSFAPFKWFYLSDQERMIEVDQLSKIELRPQETKAYTIISSTELLPEVESYADYRRSEMGGSYDVGIVDINQIRCQYGFGIKNHPLALWRFLQEAISTDSTNLSNVFIIGKGVEYAELRDAPENAIVPSLGLPGSDNLYVATAGTSYPSIPIGRLAVQSGSEVSAYLEKIILHEEPKEEAQTYEDQNWKKQIIHLSGGSSDIQNLLYNYLNDMGDVIGNRTFGGDILTFRKTSSDPIQTATSQQIIDAINGGSSIISFFGHSAVGTFDFSLEDPSKYSNSGRNPIIISLGCHSGNIHTKTTGVSEDFVLQEDNGAMVFLASSGTAYINPQYNMGLDLYQLIGEEQYGSPIGKVVQRALEMRGNQDNIAIQTLIQQFTLHGDPAYRSRIFEGPDYLVDAESVRVNPDIITASSDRIDVQFDLLNLGRSVNTPIDIMIVHEYNSGATRDTTFLTVTAPPYRLTVHTELINPGFDAVGPNQLFVIVDPQNEIVEMPTEYAEENNELVDNLNQKGIDFFVFDKSASPVYPPDFGIINESDIELIASINNAFDYGGEFELQIDTTERFDSPMFTADIVENNSSLIRWKPNIQLMEGTVYYWRIAAAEVSLFQKARRWKSQSFIYLPDGEPGWNQSHYYQWTKDEFYKLSLDSTDRQIQYDRREWDIRIKNKMKDPNDFWVFVNNSPWKSLNPKELAPGIAVFAWHPEQVIIPNTGSNFGSIPFSPDGFIFKTDTPESRKGIIDLLDFMPEGSRVFLHTLIEDESTTLNIEDWLGDSEIYGTNLIEALESYGSLRVTELLDKGAVPFTMIFDKGSGLVIEDVAEQIEGTIDLSSTGRSTWDEGHLRSTIIGPSNSWTRMEWSEELTAADISLVHLYGIKALNGTETLIRVGESGTELDLSSIDAAEYPYLRLEYSIADQERTASQLAHWRVLHEELPDAVLYASETEPFVLSDTVNAGEDLILDFNLLNISSTDLDPILVRYRLTDVEGQSTVFVQRAEGIPGNGKINFSESIKTDGLGGFYRLSIELNPSQDPKEISMLNNFGQTSIYIRPDEYNPFLDVTFDGRQITNGTVVNPNPLIAISLRDPESFVLLDNPDDFEITLQYPAVFQRTITEMDPDVTFIPAPSLDENIATLLIEPNLNVEGIYTLTVNAKDKAGNPAGAVDYRIQFEVQEDQLESYFKAWPVPFDEELNFEFTLGERLPDVFYMSIYSVDGRLVKQVNIDDFNDLRTGINRYQWDGLDLNGESLSSGIYYYEVINNLQSRGEKWMGSVVKMASY